MKIKIIGVIFLLTVTGCASITGDKLQPVSVKTTHENKEVTGIGCTLTNDAGSWSLTSPASVTVHKSTGDLVIDCKKDRVAGNVTLVSKSNSAVWGNLLIGGGVGYIVDRNTGAGFDYPADITVMLRQVDEVGNSAVSAEVASANTTVVPVVTESNAKTK
ncbi:MAG: hypothetical protein ACHP7O_04365 [Burkholderiales bacterium]